METLKITSYNRKLNQTVSIITPKRKETYTVGLKYAVDDQENEGIFFAQLLAKESLNLYDIGDIKSYLIHGTSTNSLRNILRQQYPKKTEFTHLVFLVPYKKPSMYLPDNTLLERFTL